MVFGDRRDYGGDRIWSSRGRERGGTPHLFGIDLGAALDNPNRRMVVGVHSDYPRRLKVQWQTRLSHPDTVVHTHLADVIDAARTALRL